MWIKSENSIIRSKSVVFEPTTVKTVRDDSHSEITINETVINFGLRSSTIKAPDRLIETMIAEEID